MNFVFHHHLALADSKQPCAAFGSMLPDLFRMVHRPARTQRARLDLSGESERALAQQGMAHHLAVDRWFHKTAAFLNGEASAKRQLRATSLPRAALFGHVTWEMCLDGALVRHLGEATVRSELARSIGGREGLAAELLRALHLEQGPASVDHEPIVRRLERLLEAVRSFALPRGYGSADGLADRLEGLRSAFGFERAAPAPRRLLEQSLAELFSEADQAVVVLLREWEQDRSNYQPH